jgi:hypothetical protein
MMVPEDTSGISLSAEDAARSRGDPVGWSTPRPERVPRPTVAPATLALGATLVAFGVVTSPILSAVGAALGFGAAVQWIREVHREHIR